VSGLGLICAGASAFKATTTKANPTDVTLLKIGIFVFLIGWVILSGWSLASLLPSQATPDSPTYADGSKVRLNQPISQSLVSISSVHKTTI
jgi:hypothetical protein